MARLVGAEVSEVVVMNSLTCNLHLMMAAFYQPSATRFKIVIERKAFPSDYHAVVSQIQLAGYDPDLALVEIAPREGETSLREEDIEITLEQHCAALVLFSGVQYYTGQLFDMQRITKAAHAQGAMVGFDLAHAVGNVPLSLHEWGPDFACWCTYKYMNCGPGSLGGCFVHARHGGTQRFNRPKPPRMAGWWGHRRQDRFRMEPDFIPCLGANGFRLSNPPVLLVACIRASLDLFDRAGMDKLRSKSLLLTGYLESLLRSELSNDVSIFTPADPQQRGCQLSLSFSACTVSTHIDIDTILEALQSEGVICDARKPNVIRIAPTPMYNSFRDVFEFVRILKAVLAGL
ncbi:pyridoxal phosphate-dependent transferase [Ochromonadaceae sp. CCMP2298]|nr:pyridoxal phosphate-dependent transferase [Ochromonadaceae sp. CCMP2298]